MKPKATTSTTTGAATSAAAGARSVRVSIASSGRHGGVPGRRQFELWAAAALGARGPRGDISLLLVGPARSRALNRRYRGKDQPTNVLSFTPAAAAATERGAPLLGDLVICPQVLRTEARAQHKRVRDHWAHLFIHGLLHLLGHDHEQPDEARRMELRERRVLRTLGVANPYRSH